MRIALDAMGGDLAPKATVDGGVLAARDFGVEVLLVGDQAVLQPALASHQTRGLRVEIVHATESVAMDESPLESAMAKPDSTIHRGLELLRTGAADGFVSAGNSGAVMTAAIVVLGTLPGVDRPAIASLVPSAVGPVLLIDAGANTDVKPVNLVQFALMGTAYWRQVRATPQPRVGILSNGEEDAKGNDLTRAAASALRELAPHVNYVGYVEGRDINRGKVDVVVTDGFTGNVTLKTMEGLAAFVMGSFRELFIGSLGGRLAYLLIRKRLSAMRAELDPTEYGGAPLLGIAGVTVIAHGSSSPHAIRNAVRAAANEAMVKRVNSDIADLLARCSAAGPGKPAAKRFRAMFSRMRDRLHLHSRERSAPDRNHRVPDHADWPDPHADHESDPALSHPEKEPQRAKVEGAGSPNGTGAENLQELGDDQGRSHVHGHDRPSHDASSDRPDDKE